LLLKAGNLPKPKVLLRALYAKNKLKVPWLESKPALKAKTYFLSPELRCLELNLAGSHPTGAKTCAPEIKIYGTIQYICQIQSGISTCLRELVHLLAKRQSSNYLSLSTRPEVRWMI
jgi:hypothetical protein